MRAARRVSRGTGRGTPARVAIASAISLAIAAAAIGLALAVGVEPVSLRRAIHDPGSIDAGILFDRLPRVILGAIVGAALAPAGVAFQALLRNPLADPYVLGVSGGAAVAGTAAIVLGADAGMFGDWALPAFAFLGAIAATVAVYTFGKVRGRLVPNVALLAGVVLNALAAALVVGIRLLSTPAAAHEALYWLTGSLRRVEPLRLAALGAYVAVGIAILLVNSVSLNALALGDESAHVVGVDTERSRRVVFLAASLLTGAAVAFAGPIGFVGIVVPHVLRGLLGPDHRVLVPASALIGAAFLVLADLCGRLALLVVGTQLTVGVLTALIGAPFFLVVLRGRGKERAF